MTRGKLNFSRY